MKILHTSDWHIGKKLYDKSLDETLSYFFEWLVNTIKEENIDVLLVSGDVFNNPYPSQSALSLYYRTLYELSKTNLKQVIITGGNHDSASNLNAPKELLEVLNIKVIGGVPENTDEMIIEIEGKSGETELVVAAVPFLRERDIRISTRGLSYEEHRQSISKGIEDFYNNIAEKIKDYKDKGIPVIAMGHLFVNNAGPKETEEKEYYIGGLQQINISQLPEIFDYWALGHIHKPMTVSKERKAYFCGSPVHTSFDAVANKNRVIIIDTENNDLSIEELQIPKFRNLLKLSGTFDEISEQLLSYENDKQLTAWADVQIIEQKKALDLDEKIDDLKQKLQGIEIINFSYQFAEIEEQITRKFTNSVSLKDMQPQDIFEKIIENLSENDKQEMKETFMELMENYIEKND